MLSSLKYTKTSKKQGSRHVITILRENRYPDVNIFGQIFLTILALFEKENVT